MSAPLEVLLSRLDKVKRIGRDRWIACCPAHADKSPSLAIRDADGRTLIHCFAGCSTEAVLDAVDMSFSDLMPDKPLDHHKPKVKKPFYASDILRITRDEARLVYLCASDIAKGRKLTENETARLLLAASRINHGLEVSNGL
jgi:hypothetical protein